MKSWQWLMVMTAFVALPTAGWSAPDMNDGQWEITSQMDAAGLPFAMPAMKFTQCLTSREVVPQTQDKNSDCKMTKNEISGNTVTWAVECKDKNGEISHGTGTVTYKKDSFEGSMTTVTSSKSQGKVTMKMKMSGKRLGPCK